jgi:hypothetical protein
MSSWLDNLLNRPPDVSVTSADLLAAGELVDLEELGVHVFHGGDEFDLAPVNLMTRALLTRLLEYTPEYTPESNPEGFAGGLAALLRFLVATAEDIADEDEGEPPSGIYKSDRYRQLSSREDIAREVWFQRNDAGGWTAMFPDER